MGRGILEELNYYMDLADNDPTQASQMCPFLRIDAESAGCSSQTDKDMMTEKIKKEGGFERLNLVINSVRKKMIEEEMRNRLSPTEPSVEERTHAELQNQTALLQTEFAEMRKQLQQQTDLLTPLSTE